MGHTKKLKSKKIVIVMSSKVSKDSKESTAKEAKAAKKNLDQLGLLEEDDDFEEFPAAEWDSKEEDTKDANVWEDNWDDDNVEDDFSVQLRSELGRQGVAME